ncbi:MAG: hypothetical protein KA797_03085 [Chitinophagales bacterium]|nr:hypothetical protein [Chitinophagales bacterium]
MTLRKYQGSDANLIETANIILHFVEADLTAFTSFDPTIDSTCMTDFKNKMEAALHFSRHGMMIDQQMQRTQLVGAYMKKARDIYADVKYFAGKAFPNHPEVRREIACNLISKVGNSKTEMIVFLDQLYVACTKYASELHAAGMTASKIASIQTLRIEMMDMHTLQDAFVKSRPVVTAERIATYNQLHWMIARINEAAQIVYRGNEVKQKIFVFKPYIKAKGKVIVMQAPLAEESGVESL